MAVVTLLYFQLMSTVYSPLVDSPYSRGRVEGCSTTRRCCELLNPGINKTQVTSYGCGVRDDILWYNCLRREHTEPYVDADGPTPAPQEGFAPPMELIPRRIIQDLNLMCDLETHVLKCESSPLPITDRIMRADQWEGVCIPQMELYQEWFNSADREKCLARFERMATITNRLSSNYAGKPSKYQRPRSPTPTSSSSRSSYVVQGYTTYQDGRPYVAEALWLKIREASQEFPMIEGARNVDHFRWENAPVDTSYEVCARVSSHEQGPILLGLELMFSVGSAIGP